MSCHTREEAITLSMAEEVQTRVGVLLQFIASCWGCGVPGTAVAAAYRLSCQTENANATISLSSTTRTSRYVRINS